MLLFTLCTRSRRHTITQRFQHNKKIYEPHTERVTKNLQGVTQVAFRLNLNHLPNVAYIHFACQANVNVLLGQFFLSSIYEEVE